MERYLARNGYPITKTLSGGNDSYEGHNIRRCSIVFPSLPHSITVGFQLSSTVVQFTIAASVGPFLLDRIAVGDLIEAAITVTGTANDVVTLLIGTY